MTIKSNIQRLVKNKALFFVIVFSLFWAIEIIIGKSLLLKGVKPFTILVQSQFLVVLFVGLYLLSFRRKTFKTITKKSLPWLLSFGAIGSGLGIGISYIGLNLSTATNYGFVIKSAMIFTIIIAHFMHNDDKISKAKILLGSIFLIGIYFLSTNGNLLMPNNGDILILFGAFLFGISNNIIKVLTKYKINSEVLVFFRMLGAFIVSVIFVIISKHSIFTPQYTIMLVGSAIVTIIYLYAINKTIDLSSPSYLSMMSMIVPIFVTILGIIFFKESLSLFQIFGGSLIIISGIFLERNRTKGAKNSK
jgi:drug/metabolite transporter (DMT)-like permease